VAGGRTHASPALFHSAHALQDAAAQKLNQQFIKEMKKLEEDIVADHQPRETGPENWTRTQPGPGRQATWSTCLIPGSAAGLTMRGVPYSVSI
jgi:lipoxygenase/linoleate 9S-lipoxygenase